MWKWSWVECVEPESDTSDSQAQQYESLSDDSRGTSANESSPDVSSDLDEDNFPDITHSVIFKCIGALKEHRYQETLALVAKKLKDKKDVPVQLKKEPQNPFDAQAIAFECKVDSTWERIGYVVREALGSVHEAIDKRDIMNIRFDWVKYIVQFQNRGYYAGIKITRRGEWPQHVMQCRSKSFL